MGGLVPGAPAVVSRLLSEDARHGSGDVLPSERYHAVLHVRCMVQRDSRRAPWYGRARMLPAYAPLALGGAQQQILQGRWIQIRALRHQKARHANRRRLSWFQ